MYDFMSDSILYYYIVIRAKTTSVFWAFQCFLCHQMMNMEYQIWGQWLLFIVNDKPNRLVVVGDHLL